VPFCANSVAAYGRWDGGRTGRCVASDLEVDQLRVVHGARVRPVCRAYSSIRSHKSARRGDASPPLELTMQREDPGPRERPSEQQCG